MPIIRIELYAGRSQEQKTACAREVLRVLSEQLGLSPDRSQVIFCEIERTNWMLGADLPPGAPSPKT